jgi:type I restriction enzyme, S subunit
MICPYYADRMATIYHGDCRDVLPAGINSGMVIVRNLGSVMRDSFLYEYLRSPLISVRVAAAAYGSAQPQLNLDILDKLQVTVPTAGEQQDIVRRTEVLQRTIAAEESELSKLRTLKNGLLHDLLTGRVRLPLQSEATA